MGAKAPSPRASYGPNINTAAILLASQGNVPIERTAQLMEALLGVSVSSGFVAALPAIRIAVQPVSVPYIVAVDQGSSGQLVVTIKAVANARSYELRYGLVSAAGAIVNWTTIMVPNAKPATILNNFTPGGTYTFQVRAYGKLGFSDWSALVERMCI